MHEYFVRFSTSKMYKVDQQQRLFELAIQLLIKNIFLLGY
jgi:hypothetical protein